MKRNVVSALLAALVIHSAAQAKNMRVTPPNALASKRDTSLEEI